MDKAIYIIKEMINFQFYNRSSASSSRSISPGTLKPFNSIVDHRGLGGVFVVYGSRFTFNSIVDHHRLKRVAYMDEYELKLSIL